jgi:hypothetical protein
MARDEPTLDPWAVLGLAPTADEAAILRAYAAKLRQTRPDDDPEGFQRLVRARELALAWRKAAPPPDEGEADPPPRSPRAEAFDAEASGGAIDAAAKPPPLRWRAPRATPESPDPALRPPPVGAWRAAAAAGGPDWSRDDEGERDLAALRARLRALAAEPDATFRDLGSWETILSAGDRLGLLARDRLRGDLVALLADRLPALPADATPPDAGLLKLAGRLDQELDLARALTGPRRAGDELRFARLADWLNAFAAERAVARRRERGEAAYRLDNGAPLIPPEDRSAALARRDLMAIYEEVAARGRSRWRAGWGGAWAAALAPASVAALLDAPLLSLLAIAVEIAGVAVASNALNWTATPLASAAGLRLAWIRAAAGLAILAAARLMAMSLWPSFAIRRAAKRTRRADRAGLFTPAARKPILSRRFSTTPFFTLAMLLATWADLGIAASALGILSVLLDARR